MDKRGRKLTVMLSSEDSEAIVERDPIEGFDAGVIGMSAAKFDYTSVLIEDEDS